MYERGNYIMTPEQAIKNLDTATAPINANRETHLVLMESVAILSKVVAHCREQGLIELIFEKENVDG